MPGYFDLKKRAALVTGASRHATIADLGIVDVERISNQAQISGTIRVWDLSRGAGEDRLHL